MKDILSVYKKVDHELSMVCDAIENLKKIQKSNLFSRLHDNVSKVQGFINVKIVFIRYTEPSGTAIAHFR